MTVQVLPLTNDSEVSFNVEMGGDFYQCRSRWNDVSEKWALDIENTRTKDSIDGLILTGGTDLFQQFP